MRRNTGWQHESARHGLAAKGVKTGSVRLYDYDTKVGRTKVLQLSNDAGIMHQYITELDSPQHQAALQKLRDTIKANFKLNPYGEAYLAELETSFSLYGKYGVKTQLAYIMSNARPTTDAGKQFKKDVVKGKLAIYANGKGKHRSVESFVRDNREMIDEYIRRKVPGQRIDDDERRLWVLNDEYLYNLAKSTGVLVAKGTRKGLDVFERHRLVIAKRTLQMPDEMVNVLGGMTKEEAREVVKRFG